MSTAVITAVATVIAALIAGLVAYATSRTAAKSEVRRQETASRTDIEKEAFDRAKGYYTDTIDRQSREITELEGDVARLKGQVATLDQQLTEARAGLAACKRTLRHIRGSEFE